MPNTISKVLLFDCISQETIVRDMNEDELLQLSKTRAKEQNREAEAAAKAAARQAVLDKLGITADEAKLLLG